jgi:DNA-binding MarR family transcriptional regulator
VTADSLPDDGSGRDPHAGLDERLGAALDRMGHVTRTMLARQAYAEGVSGLQFQLLLRLQATAVRPRVSDLAAELDVSQATVSDALSAMRRKGLVAREQDPADRRATVFTLTDDGERLSARLARWDAPLTSALARLDRADKGAALHLVLGLVADLHREGVVGVARTCLTCRFFDDATHPDDPDPFRCTLLDVAFDDTALRVDCQEHEPA